MLNAQPHSCTDAAPREKVLRRSTRDTAHACSGDLFANEADLVSVHPRAEPAFTTRDEVYLPLQQRTTTVPVDPLDPPLFITHVRAEARIHTAELIRLLARELGREEEAEIEIEQALQEAPERDETFRRYHSRLFRDAKEARADARRRRLHDEERSRRARGGDAGAKDDALDWLHARTPPRSRHTSGTGGASRRKSRPQVIQYDLFSDVTAAGRANPTVPEQSAAPTG